MTPRSGTTHNAPIPRLALMSRRAALAGKVPPDLGYPCPRETVHGAGQQAHFDDGRQRKAWIGHEVHIAGAPGRA